MDGFVYAFTRGAAALVVLSGYTAKQHPEELPRTVALTNLPEGMRGTTLYNIFNPNVSALGLCFVFQQPEVSLAVIVVSS